MKNILKVAMGVLAILWLLGKCSSCGEDYEYTEDSDTMSECVESEDYSWLYGKWELNENGDRYIVSFAENGMYIETLISPVFGNSSGAGSYRVSGDRIILDCGDGYPAYITIEGKRLKDDSGYYRKK